MAIYRGGLIVDHFTMVPNAWLRDPRLPLSDKGLLAYITSHAPGHPLTIEQVIAESTNGYDSVNAAMKRLEALGYLRRERQRGENGKLHGYDWYLSDPTEYPETTGFSRTGPDQGEQDVSAGRNQSGKTGTGPDQGKQGVSAGRNQSGKTGTGPDQGKQGVSAGRNQSGKSGTKKTMVLEDQEENPPTPHCDQLSETAVSVGADTRGDFPEEKTPETGASVMADAPLTGAAPNANGAERTDREGQLDRGVLSGVVVPVVQVPAAGRPSAIVAPVLDDEIDREVHFWDRARVVLRSSTTGLAPAKMPSKAQGDQLVRLTGAALSAGWSEAELIRVLGDGDLNEAKSVAGLLRYRLEKLPATPAPVARRVGPVAGEVAEWRRERPVATSASQATREAARALVSRRAVRVERPVRSVRGAAATVEGPSAGELLDALVGELVAQS
jgi:hypothetical protein